MGLTEEEVRSLFCAITGREPADRLAIRSLTGTDLATAIKRLAESYGRTGSMNNWERNPVPAKVDMLYRILLDRDVESDAVRLSAAKAASVSDLLRDIALSDEFQSKIASDEILKRALNRARRSDASQKRSDKVVLFGA